MSGLAALAYAVLVATTLMVALFLLSRALLRFALLPLSAAFSTSGFNLILFYLLILPGTIVHEVSHYLACILTGVRVREVRLFSPQKNGAIGWVIHDQADMVRRNIIAFAPFVGGSLAIYGLVRIGLPFGQLDPLALAPNDPAQGFVAIVGAIADSLRAADTRQLGTWVSLYLLFSLGFAVAPSPPDLGHLLADAGIVLCIAVVVVALDDQFSLGLGQSSLLNGVATALARGLQQLNALLLFSCAVVALGAVVIIPVSLLAYRIRAGFS